MFLLCFFSSSVYILFLCWSFLEALYFWYSEVFWCSTNTFLFYYSSYLFPLLVISVFVVLYTIVVYEISLYILSVVLSLLVWFIVVIMSVENTLFSLLVGLLYLGGLIVFFSFSSVLFSMVGPSDDYFCSFFFAFAAFAFLMWFFYCFCSFTVFGVNNSSFNLYDVGNIYFDISIMFFFLAFFILLSLFASVLVSMEYFL